MAMSLPPSGEAGEERYAPLAEINVTPMVDVMLVLLVIFMVTAPLLTVAVEADDHRFFWLGQLGRARFWKIERHADS